MPSYPKAPERPYTAHGALPSGAQVWDKPGGGRQKSKSTFERNYNEMNDLKKIRPKIRTKNRGGAPKGNRNALKIGLHTADLRARKAKVRRLVRHARAAIAEAHAAAAREIREMRQI